MIKEDKHLVDFAAALGDCGSDFNDLQAKSAGNICAWDDQAVKDSLASVLQQTNGVLAGQKKIDVSGSCCRNIRMMLWYKDVMDAFNNNFAGVKMWTAMKAAQKQLAAGKIKPSELESVVYDQYKKRLVL